MTYFDQNTDLYMEVAPDGYAMPRTRAIKINDELVNAYLTRNDIGDGPRFFDLSGVSLREAIAASQIAANFPAAKDEDGTTILQCYVVTPAIPKLLAWAISRIDVVGHGGPT
jgi:hypothetical protein